MGICAVQLGAPHQALQKLVDVLPEIKHKVSCAQESAQTDKPNRVEPWSTHKERQQVSSKSCGEGETPPWERSWGRADSRVLDSGFPTSSHAAAF